MQRYQLHNSGKSVPPQGETWFETQNPFTGESWAEFPRGNASDVDAAAQAAHSAYTEGPWAELTTTTGWWRTRSSSPELTRSL